MALNGGFKFSRLKRSSAETLVQDFSDMSLLKTSHIFTIMFAVPLSLEKNTVLMSRAFWIDAHGQVSQRP